MFLEGLHNKILDEFKNNGWNDPQRVDTFLFVDLVYLGRLVQRTGEVNATEIYRRV